MSSSALSPYYKAGIWGLVGGGGGGCCMYESRYRVHAYIMRQLVLWDIHTNKYGSFQFGGQCIVLYEICYLIS